MSAVSVTSSISASAASPESVERGGDVVKDPGVLHLAGRQVDAHVERVVGDAGRLPRGGCPARLVEHPPAERDDRAPSSSAIGMNSFGADEPADGMLPTHERLGAERASAADVDDRLVEHDELVVRRSRRAARRRSRGDDSPRRASPGGTARTGPCRCAWRRTSQGRRRGARRSARGCRGDPTAMPMLACTCTSPFAAHPGSPPERRTERGAPPGSEVRPAAEPRRGRRSPPAARTRHRRGGQRW